MTTSRSTSRGARKRNGIIGYLGNIVDDTKEYIDDVLDRGHDVDHDLRSTARRALHGDDDSDSDPDADIAALRQELDDLVERVGQLSGAQSGSSAQQKKGS